MLQTNHNNFNTAEVAPLLVVIAIFIFVYAIVLFFEKKEDSDKIKKALALIKKDYLEFLNDANKKLADEFEINELGLKRDLLDILQDVDQDALGSKLITKQLCDRLLENKNYVTAKYFDWLSVVFNSNAISKCMDNKDKILNDLITEYNNASSKHTCITTMHANLISIIGTYDPFNANKDYYEKHYFNKIMWLLENSYDALEFGNYEKAFKLKVAYDDLLSEVKTIFQEPYKYMSKITSFKVELSSLEEDLSSNHYGSRYKTMLNKVKNEDVTGKTLALFDEFKVKREVYWSTTKWSNDEVVKINELKKLKYEMINIISKLDADILHKSNLRKSLSRAGNQVEAEPKIKRKSTWSDIFNVSLYNEEML